MKEITKKYPNNEITIVWKPHLCCHSTNCWKGSTGLIDVFNPARKPWIEPNNADADRIIEQIEQCPSGALSFIKNDTYDQSS